MKNNLMILVMAASISCLNAQSKKTKDKRAIKQLCGCFEVSFNFFRNVSLLQRFFLRSFRNQNGWGIGIGDGR